MDKEKRNRLEAAGFRVGDAGDFLGLTDAEREIIEFRLELSKSIYTLRTESGLTQKQLAAKLKSSQSRIAKIEASEADVSLDLMFRAFVVVGGRLKGLRLVSKPRQKAKKLAPHKSKVEVEELNVTNAEL